MHLSFRAASLTGEAGETTNTRAAAILAAHDFPLNLARTFSSVKGDGITGVQVTWHFEEVCPAGNHSALAMKALNDPKRPKEVPGCTLIMCKRAFRRAEDLTNHAKRKVKLELPRPAPPPFKETNDPRCAAAMEKLGHRMIGSRWVGSQLRFQFHEVAATDLALWDLSPAELGRRLPEAPIAYLSCAFDWHRGMVDMIKQVGAQFAAVQHGERTAYVGKDMSAVKIDELENLLYRR